MKYDNPASFRQALQDRIRSQTGGDGARVVRERKRIAFDRLLARLVATAPGQWLLKGGFALDMRLVDRARSTRDVDIDWQTSEEELFETLIEAATYDAGDFFTFSIERSGVPPDRLGGSYRFKVTAVLAGRPFERFLLDVGIRKPGVAGETLRPLNYLSFADIDPIEVEAIPLELHVAEKIHAYTRVYEGGKPSSRAKDLIDLALIAELSPLDAAKLRNAIDSTFGQRKTHPLPPTLPPPPPEWATQFRRLADEVGLSTDLTTGHKAARAFVDPVLTNAVSVGTWQPGRGCWLVGGDS